MATTTRPDTPRGMQPPDRRPVRITVPEREGKARFGDPFWPKAPFQAIFYIAATFAALIILAVSNPAPLQDPADPLNHAAIDPRPEWYFMFLFQLLKYFQGQYVLVGTAIIPGILTVLLLLLPFYDRNWARHITRRPVAAGSMSIAMLAIIWLTWGGLGFPTPNFSTTPEVATVGPVSSTGAISPQVDAIFQAHCAQCHIATVSGGLSLANFADLVKGGTVVSGSVIVPGNHAASTLWKIVQPTGPWPGGVRMPLSGPPYLSAADINTIASWIDGLPKQGGTSHPVVGPAPTPTPSSGAGGTTGVTGQVSFKRDIQPIFQAHCAQCHISTNLGGLSLASYQGLIKGGNIVPGSIVTPGNPQGSTLYKIVAPSGSWPGGSRMPLSGPPYLDNAQIQTIANWIKQGAKDN